MRFSCCAYLCQPLCGMLASLCISDVCRELQCFATSLTNNMCVSISRPFTSTSCRYETHHLNTSKTDAILKRYLVGPANINYKGFYDYDSNGLYMTLKRKVSKALVEVQGCTLHGDCVHIVLNLSYVCTHASNKRNAKTASWTRIPTLLVFRWYLQRDVFLQAAVPRCASLAHVLLLPDLHHQICVLGHAHRNHHLLSPRDRSQFSPSGR